jgi:hypothetical protein
LRAQGLKCAATLTLPHTLINVTARSHCSPALNTLDGSVVSRCEQRPRHTEWLDFLRQIDREIPKDQSLHLICDNYATRKHPKVKEWLEKHPSLRGPLHADFGFVVEYGRTLFPRAHHWPSASWRVPQPSRNSMPPSRNTSPCITKPSKPFVWTAKANDILQKVIRANRHLSSQQNDSIH